MPPPDAEAMQSLRTDEDTLRVCAAMVMTTSGGEPRSVASPSGIASLSTTWRTDLPAIAQAAVGAG